MDFIRTPERDQANKSWSLYTMYKNGKSIFFKVLTLFCGTKGLFCQLMFYSVYGNFMHVLIPLPLVAKNVRLQRKVCGFF